MPVLSRHFGFTFNTMVPNEPETFGQIDGQSMDGLRRVRPLPWLSVRLAWIAFQDIHQGVISVYASFIPCQALRSLQKTFFLPVRKIVLSHQPSREVKKAPVKLPIPCASRSEPFLRNQTQTSQAGKHVAHKSTGLCRPFTLS